MRCDRKIQFLTAALLYACGANAQVRDSISVLDAVVVHGYAADRPLNEVPAAIGYVDSKAIDRFNQTSVVNAMNTVPGVRMEERSPGSYRFAIRGSSLRSPFGVRNVKMYWNGLPLTDGGGNTYLNLLDPAAIGSAEIIKGPGSSLYGAGTGGVVLLNSPVIRKSGAQLSSTLGSYGLRRYQAAIQSSNDKIKYQLLYARQQADGYRQQSAMRRDAANGTMLLRTGSRGTLSANILYTDLYYQTPGGLTLAEYRANKKEARPTTPVSPGSVVQQAAISNRTGFAGISYDQDWSSHWSNRTGAYGSLTSFVNPAIRNFETRRETNFGGRTETYFKKEYTQWKIKATFGGEFQYFHSPLTDYGNRAGIRDSVQFADKLDARQEIAFAQTEFDLPAGFIVTAGASTTFLQYRFLRTSEVNPARQIRNFTPVLSPRLAVLKTFSPSFAAYVSASQGFSPPSLAEVRPSSNLYNNSLNPEYGRNFEAGIRGSLFAQRFTFNITGYQFSLHQAIVTPDGGDHYQNSGKTSQPGLEAGTGWNVLRNTGGPVTDLRIWCNATYNPYTFRDYQASGHNYSGSKLTGTARDNIVAGADLTSASGAYCNLTFTHTGAITVQDQFAGGTNAWAPSYYLLSAKAGIRFAAGKKVNADLCAGADNLFNSRYSLGNDLNAAGGRYFNAAAPQAFYVSLRAVL